ncbi:MFS-type transporter clz9-like [Cryptomeria japonica]|uniref:MFS-type transporter clz9-like n=1 Tax=Cryptomeria japonica TaxID=3369 RepID=UPI0027DA31CC|nr:MFS-type transporter clz9-like [Cryptomeria japonica]
MAGYGHGLEIINLKARHHELSLRTAEGLNKDWTLCLRPAIVSAFYETLSKTYIAIPYGPTRIWNCDETRVMTDINGAMKVLAMKGSQNVSYIVPKSREWITILCCVNASGQRIIGFYMFKGKRQLQNYIAKCELGACMAAQQHAWMTKELFMNWLHHFERFVPRGVSPTNRCLLIFDSHNNHVALPTIQEARMLGINLPTLPAHTSHKFQPLDDGDIPLNPDALTQEMQPNTTFHINDGEDASAQKWLRKTLQPFVKRIQLHKLTWNRKTPTSMKLQLTLWMRVLAFHLSELHHLGGGRGDESRC